MAALNTLCMTETENDLKYSIQLFPLWMWEIVHIKNFIHCEANTIDTVVMKR